MATKIEVDRNKVFEKWVRQVVRGYRGRVFRSLAGNLDRIRYRAVNFIIKRRADLDPDKLSPYSMAKIQKTHPTKLTERTGALITMLLAKASWGYNERTEKRSGFTYQGTKTAKMATPYMRGVIEVTSGFNSSLESYRASLYADIQEGAPLVGKIFKRTKVSQKSYRDNGDEINQRYSWARKETRQTLYMRFKHETGLRGRRRPFIEPSAKRESIEVGKIIKQRLDELRSY